MPRVESFKPHFELVFFAASLYRAKLQGQTGLHHGWGGDLALSARDSSSTRVGETLKIPLATDPLRFIHF